MKVCDICAKAGIFNSALEVDTPLGQLDLCDRHSEELKEVVTYAASVFWSSTPGNSASVDESRLRPTWPAKR